MNDCSSLYVPYSLCVLSTIALWQCTLNSQSLEYSCLVSLWPILICRNALIRSGIDCTYAHKIYRKIPSRAVSIAVHSSLISLRAAHFVRLELSTAPNQYTISLMLGDPSHSFSRMIHKLRPDDKLQFPVGITRRCWVMWSPSVDEEKLQRNCYRIMTCFRPTNSLVPRESHHSQLWNHHHPAQGLINNWSPRWILKTIHCLVTTGSVTIRPHHKTPVLQDAINDVTNTADFMHPVIMLTGPSDWIFCSNNPGKLKISEVSCWILPAFNVEVICVSVACLLSEKNPSGHNC